MLLSFRFPSLDIYMLIVISASIKMESRNTQLFNSLQAHNYSYTVPASEAGEYELLVDTSTYLTVYTLTVKVNDNGIGIDNVPGKSA